MTAVSVLRDIAPIAAATWAAADLADSRSALESPGAQAGDHVLLDDEEHAQHGREDEQTRGHDHPPSDHGGIVEVGDATGRIFSRGRDGLIGSVYANWIGLCKM